MQPSLSRLRRVQRSRRKQPALNSFLKKCKREACEPKAVSSEGKPLAGAAKKSFMDKCEKDA